ncbi:MAG: DUF2917 domain-containing protein [Betaproteobacteria bacterium]
MSTFDARPSDRYIGTVGFWIIDDEIARIESGRGLLLSVQYGTVWITQAGSIRDIFVKAGESFLIRSEGRTLVSLGGSEATAALTLTPSVRMAPTLAQRVAAGVSGLASAIATFVVPDRGVRAGLPSDVLPAPLDAGPWNLDGFRHAA